MPSKSKFYKHLHPSKEFFNKYCANKSTTCFYIRCDQYTQYILNLYTYNVKTEKERFFLVNWIQEKFIKYLQYSNFVIISDIRKHPVIFD